MWILLVENDSNLAGEITHILTSRDFQVQRYQLNAVDTSFEMQQCVCAVIDVTQSNDATLDFIQRIRDTGLTLPVLALSQQNEARDRVQGLNSGADDYLGIPFDSEELVARVKALIRGSKRYSPRSEIITIGNAVLSTKFHTLTVGKQEVWLPPKEFFLCEYLAVNSGQILTHEQLITHIWGSDEPVAVNALETYVYFLRKRFSSIGCTSHIKTVRSVGYQLIREE